MKAFATKLVLTILALCALAAAPLAAQAAPIGEVYAWNDARMDVGHFYHYVFTDMKGNGPQDTYLYISGKGEYQLLNNAYQAKYQKAITFITCKLNPFTAFYTTWDVVNLLPASDKSYRNAHYDFDLARGKVLYDYLEIKDGKDKPQKGEMDWEANVYKAGSTGVEFAIFFRQLRDGVKPFVLRYQDALNRTYNMDCSYEKDEVVDGIPCRKYLIKGQGLLAKVQNVQGAVWLAKDDPVRYMVKHTMNMRVDWDYGNAMVVMAERRPMTPAEWKAFQEALVLKQKKSF